MKTLAGILLTALSVTLAHAGPYPQPLPPTGVQFIDQGCSTYDIFWDYMHYARYYRVERVPTADPTHPTIVYWDTHNKTLQPVPRTGTWTYYVDSCGTDTHYVKDARYCGSWVYAGTATWNAWQCVLGYQPKDSESPDSPLQPDGDDDWYWH